MNTSRLEMVDRLRQRARDGDIIVTLCTNGYVSYTRNLVASLARLGLMEMAAVVCTDSSAVRSLSNEGIDSFYFPATEQPSAAPEQVPYNGEGWPQIVKAKIEIVHALLGAGLNVIWTDGDVVWLRNPLSDLKASVGSSHLAFQCTGLVDRRTRWDEPSQCWIGPPPLDRRGEGEAPFPNMCAGFYYARATDECRQLFDPSRINRDTFGLEEHHLNDVLRSDNLRVAMLDPRLYANGKLWLRHPEPGLDPLVIHYNYISGAAKKSAMIEHGHWYDTRPEATSSTQAESWRK